MLNFDFLEKGLGIVSPPHFLYDIPTSQISDQISLSDCLYFLSYWAICVLQIFLNQIVMS